ncbi:MAG: FlgO family outer membrane protein [Acidobacteriota bacterium]|nr:FlgO family outer membrane protein [Acidobacteriota bacterium]
MKTATDEQTAAIYEFGHFLLDTRERTLLLEGRAVALTPKAFDTLLVLVENSGHVIEKGELMRRVWPDAFVEENNLAQNISLLRKVLDEQSNGIKYIETVPRRGYRFTADVKSSADAPANRLVIEHVRQSVVIEEEDETDDSAETIINVESEPVATDTTGTQALTPTHSASSVLAAEAPQATSAKSKRSITNIIQNRRALVFVLTFVTICAAATAYLISNRQNSQPRAAAKTRSLAILPFRNLKPDKETDFLGLSLADAIITKLSFVRTLNVRPSSYIEKYQGQEIDPRKVADELQVDTLLTGSFLKDGDNLRVNAQLINISSNEILWRDSIDLKYERLLTVQDYVAEQIIKGLQLNVSPNETERLKLDTPQNPLAYEDFLRGRYLISTNDHKAAIKLLEESVALDPDYALAWAYLGKAYSVTASQYFGGREFEAKAQAAYERALSLNPQQLEARILLANFLTENNRVEEAVPLLRKVIEDNPNHPFAHWELSYAYRYAGMLQESILEGEQALRLYPNLTGQLFNSYFYVGQYEKFLDSLPPRDNAYTLFYRGLGYYYMKDTARATVNFDRAYELDPSPIVSQLGRAFRLSIAGKNLEGLELLRASEQKMETGGAVDGEICYKLAQGYAVLGDNASALRLLRRSIESGFFCYPYFISDPLIDNLRSEPEYTAIMEQARERHEEFKRKLF